MRSKIIMRNVDDTLNFRAFEKREENLKILMKTLNTLPAVILSFYSTSCKQPLKDRGQLGYYSDLFAGRISFQYFQVAEKSSISIGLHLQDEIMHLFLKPQAVFSEHYSGKRDTVMTNDRNKWLLLLLKCKQHVEDDMSICGN